MSQNVFIWSVDESTVAVLPPHTGGEWRFWLDVQDATHRKYVTVDNPKELGFDGYWVFDPDLCNWDGFYVLCSRLRWNIRAESPLRYGNKNPYHLMFVVSEAPKIIVDAAYKALMLVHHPDKGGSDEKSQILNEAKEKIYHQRGW